MLRSGSLFRNLTALISALSMVALPFEGPAFAQNVLPQGGSVVGGSATISQSGSTLNINQSTARAILNWNSFSVGQSNIVNFYQPNSSSAALNRVTGAALSTIAGQIHANGQVYLINPNGIALTPSGLVEVGGGFVASSLDIANSDFMAGNLVFRGSGSSGRVSNQGTITTGPGGFVGLFGGFVSNEGTITVPLGKVGLGSGEMVTLDLNGDGFMQVAVPTNSTTSNGKSLIDVAGAISALGGKIQLAAATVAQAIRDAVNVSGSLSATSMAGRNGSVVLGGGPGGNVKVSGSIDISGAESAGKILTDGYSVALSGAKLSAQSLQGTGGAIIITAANDVALSSSTLDASGATGGGLVRVGGDFQGGNADPSNPLYQSFIGRFGTLPSITAAKMVTVDAGTKIDVSARATGDGGTAIIWSDQATAFAGTINAMGGQSAGNGGFVEVSSHNILDFAGGVNLSTVVGTPGTLLLDPYNVKIDRPASTSNDSLSGGTFTPSGKNAVVNADALQTALASGNVIVTTTGPASSPGSQVGNLTVAASVTWNNSQSLTFSAANNIILQANVNGGASGRLVLTSGNEINATSNAITAGALTGSSVGNAHMEGANQVATFGGFTSGGTLSFTNAQSFTTAGLLSSVGALTLTTTGAGHNLTLGGAVTASGQTVTLNSAGTITQSSGVIAATTLTGNSVGGANLTKANQVANIGGFSNTGSGALSFTDNQALATSGALSSAGNLTLTTTTGSLTLNDNVSGVTVALNSAGAITQSSGVIAATTLTGNSVGGANLTKANQVANIGGFSNTGSGALSFTDNQTLATSGDLSSAGNLTLTTTGAGSNLALNNNVSGVTVVLNSAGTITQTGGIITAATLTGSSGSNATMTGANQVATFGPFTSGGKLDFTNAQSFATAGTLSSASNLTLTTTGVGHNLTLGGDLTASGQTVALNSAGTITQSGGVITAATLTGSSVGGATLDQSNKVANIGGFSNTGSGALSFTDNQALATSGALSSVGNLTLTTTTGGLTLNDNLTGVTVALNSAGTITQSGGVIAATTLTGNSVGGADLTKANQVGTFGSFASGDTLSFTNAQSFATTGTVSSVGNMALTTTAGDITVNGTLSFGNSTLALNSAHDIAINQAINSGSGGGLILDAVHNISATAGVSVGTFILNSGTWSQVALSLPAFAANDFRITGGTFVRALGGNGSGSPYQIADVYGLQGIGSSGMLGNNYVLANDIAAAGTASWNSGAGFAPIGNASNQFTGLFNGQSHAINNLFINRPGSDNVGLFGVVGFGGTVENVNLNLNVASGLIRGYDNVGAIAGLVDFGAILNSNVTGPLTALSPASRGVIGHQHVGGLVGFNHQGTITSDGTNIVVTGVIDVGGLVGFNDPGIVTNSFASGAVSGQDNVGGLVGHNDVGSKVTLSSFGGGAVTGNSYVNVLIGFNAGSATDSSAYGTVNGAARIATTGTDTGLVASSARGSDNTSENDDSNGPSSDKKKKGGVKCTGSEISSQISKNGAAVITGGSGAGCT